MNPISKIIHKSIRWRLLVPIVLLNILLGVALYQYIATLFRQSAIENLVDKGRTIVELGEAAREYTTQQNNHKVFHYDEILAKENEEERVESFLRTVPVFSSMEVVKSRANDLGYVANVLRTKPRNYDHTPDVEEEEVLNTLESSRRKDYHYIDQESKNVVYYRAIRLSEDCLMCHGDPATSLSVWGRDDGKDITGSLMEGKKAGDFFGAYVLKMSLVPTEEALAKAMMMVGGVIFFVTIMLSFAVYIAVEYIQGKLKAICELQEKVAKGDTSARLEVLAEDELNLVMKGFNSMVDSIEDGLRKIAIERAEVEIKIEEAVAEKNNLLNIVAHDLKNPLASVILTSENLILYKHKMTDQQMVDSLKKIDTTAQRMVRLIERVLSVNSLEQKKYTPIIEAVHLCDVLETLAEEYEPAVRRKGISIDIDNQVKACNFAMDKFALFQILDNLLSNAVKYSDHNTRIHIAAFTRQFPDTLCIQVTDQGPGVTEEEKKAIFDEFITLANKPTGGEKATGIGLSIVKKFVQSLGGSIDIHSDKGRGTTFEVLLPLITIPAESDATIIKQERGAQLLQDLWNEGQKKSKAV